MITQRYYLHFLIVFSMFFLCVYASPARAAITASGDVSPADLSTWTNAYDISIGGRLPISTATVDSGSDVNCFSVFLGETRGCTGELTVDGDGSTWSILDRCVVGNHGNGTLNITNGGVMGYNSRLTWGPIGSIGESDYSVGKVTVDGAGSKWSIAHLYVGFYGKGTLNITNGGEVSNTYPGWDNYIGYNMSSTGSMGMVTVDGTNSKWTNNSDLYVGYQGKGSLNITGGGAVSNTHGYVGVGSSLFGTMDMVTVDGTNSKWTNSSSLSIVSSYYGKGILNITGGGGVTATVVGNSSKSLLAMDVGNGSLLNVNNGSGTFSNGGQVRIMAGANATEGIAYTPISAGAWTGTGTYQAIGGTWDTTAHTFLASVVQQGLSGTQLTIDLADKQRLLVTDGQNALGASFAPTATPTMLDFTASVMSSQDLSGLLTLLDANQSVLSAWQITASGIYSADNPAYLSFDVGAGRSRNNVTVWHLDGGTWNKFDATDLTCNADFASFTATGFGGYALTVPEPGTLIMLASGLLSIFVYVRRRIIR
jgi:T5SS/PEP-CTERM-associated repeat protein